MPFLIPKGFIFNLYFLIPKLYFPHDNHVYYFLLYHWWFFFNVILKECFLYCLIFIFLNSLPYLNVQLAYRCLSPECLLLACCRLLRYIMSKSDHVLFHHIFFLSYSISDCHSPGKNLNVTYFFQFLTPCYYSITTANESPLESVVMLFLSIALQSLNAGIYHLLYRLFQEFVLCLKDKNKHY